MGGVDGGAPVSGWGSGRDTSEWVGKRDGHQ